MTSETELAWAAGFFDGEGSVYVHNIKRAKGGTGKYYPVTSVVTSLVQTREEPIDRFISAVGVGYKTGPHKQRKENHKPYWRWETSGRPSTYETAIILWPYLSKPKREQFHKCWEELRLKRSKKSPELKELPDV